MRNDMTQLLKVINKIWKTSSN